MKKVKIHCIDGYYYIEDNILIYVYEDYDQDTNYNEIVDCQVEHLADLTIAQYNELVEQLNKHYPDYAIECLTGRFI